MTKHNLRLWEHIDIFTTKYSKKYWINRKRNDEKAIWIYGAVNIWMDKKI